MPRSVALLRGVNLGSRNKVSKVKLRTLFEALGATDVVPYVNSGNVAFTTDAASSLTRAAIEAQLGRDHDLSVAVLLRSAAELAAVVASNPFLGREADRKALHVTFLAEQPAAERAARLGAAADRGKPDELALHGRDVYLHTPGGYGRTKLGNAFLERQLAVTATTRNWNTVTALEELANA